MSDISKANSLLELAQKTHDEFVAQGQAEKERLIKEGKEYREKKIAESSKELEELLEKINEARVFYERSLAKIVEFGQGVTEYANVQQSKMEQKP